jgi:hypothetical protein
VQKASGAKQRVTPELEAELAAIVIRKQQFCKWTPGRQLPAGATDDADDIEAVSLISAAQWLTVFLRSDRAVLASYDAGASADADTDCIEDDGLFDRNDQKE